MVETLFGVLASALSIWDNLEKRKYIDKLTSLRRDYREEWNKDPAVRSDAKLDDLVFELRILGDAFSASARTADTKN